MTYDMGIFNAAMAYTVIFKAALIYDILILYADLANHIFIFADSWGCDTPIFKAAIAYRIANSDETMNIR